MPDMGCPQRTRDDAPSSALQEWIKQSTGGGDALTMDSKLDKLLATGERLEDKIDCVVVKLDLLREDSKKVAVRVSVLETMVQTSVPEAQAMEHYLMDLEVHMRWIRARLNNIKVIGLPEGAEGN
ncbi:hypothetical protein NDU88_001852 [Pleurodeles waltl]|uniref:Uncharacterized protein n=1 Tax=Pleurodeles waltl TaxID=8319 RepID=A0AAV7SC17_PLEWA|nr:hypothetical protein NDU88_001852 [Pleurodeles waltl]